MKTWISVLAVLCLLLSCRAMAEDAQMTPFDAVLRLLNGRRAEVRMELQDVQGIGEEAAPYTSVSGRLCQEGDAAVLKMESPEKVLLSVTLDGEGYLAEGDFGAPFAASGSWGEAAPAVELQKAEGARALSVRLTGPDHALITLTWSLEGETAEEYMLDWGVMLLNADGTIQNFFDTVTSEGGETARESLICLGDYDLTVEGEGREEVTEEDGRVTWKRVDACTFCLDGDEIGTAQVAMELSILE